MYLQWFESVGTGRDWIGGSCSDQEFGHIHSSGNGSSCKSDFCTTRLGVAQASLTDRSRDEIPGSCRNSTMQRAGYVAGGCLGRGSIGFLEKEVLSGCKNKGDSREVSNDSSNSYGLDVKA